MVVDVVRHNFYCNTTLKWNEVCDDHVCRSNRCCDQIYQKRPSLLPHSITELVSVIVNGHDIETKISVCPSHTSNGLNVEVSSGRSYNVTKPNYWPNSMKNKTYFSIDQSSTHGGHVDGSIGIERLFVNEFGTGMVSTDSSTTQLFFGPHVSTSKFFNGHSPSNVVDTSVIGDYQIWTHTSFPEEKWGMLEISIDELNMLWSLRRSVLNIYNIAKVALVGRDVDSVKSILSTHSPFIDSVGTVSTICQKIHNEYTDLEFVKQAFKITTNSENSRDQSKMLVHRVDN